MWELVTTCQSTPADGRPRGTARLGGSFGHAGVGRWGGWTARTSPRDLFRGRMDPECLAVTHAFRARRELRLSFQVSIQSGLPIDNGGPWTLLDLLTLACCVQEAIRKHPPGLIARADLEELDDSMRAATGPGQRAVEADGGRAMGV